MFIIPVIDDNADVLINKRFDEELRDHQEAFNNITSSLNKLTDVGVLITEIGYADKEMSAETINALHEVTILLRKILGQ